MTFAIFIVLILGLFIAFLNLLPIASALSFSFTPSVIAIVNFMKAWDFIFPIHELFVMLSIFVGLELTLWGLKQLRAIIKFIRGHSDGA